MKLKDLPNVQWNQLYHQRKKKKKNETIHLSLAPLFYDKGHSGHFDTLKYYKQHISWVNYSATSLLLLETICEIVSSKDIFSHFAIKSPLSAKKISRDFPTSSSWPDFRSNPKNKAIKSLKVVPHKTKQKEKKHNLTLPIYIYDQI